MDLRSLKLGRREELRIVISLQCKVCTGLYGATVRQTHSPPLSFYTHAAIQRSCSFSSLSEKRILYWLQGEHQGQRKCVICVTLRPHTCTSRDLVLSGAKRTLKVIYREQMANLHVAVFNASVSAKNVVMRSWVSEVQCCPPESGSHTMQNYYHG